MDQLSHVNYYSAQVQALLDAAGSKVELTRKTGVTPNAIRRAIRGEGSRLKTVEKLARGSGRSIAEMFLAPGVETDWYRDAARGYLPKNLAEWSDDSGLSLDEIAEAVGVPYQTYVLYLEGRQAPETDTLQRIADALEVDVADLFLPPDGGDGYGVDY